MENFVWFPKVTLTLHCSKNLLQFTKRKCCCRTQPAWQQKYSYKGRKGGIKKNGWIAWKRRDKERKVGKKENTLDADEVKVDEQISSAENLLKESTMRLSKATAVRNMQEIEATGALIEKASANLSAIKKHRKKITTVKDVLRKRRKALLKSVIPSNK